MSGCVPIRESEQEERHSSNSPWRTFLSSADERLCLLATRAARIAQQEEWWKKSIERRQCEAGQPYENALRMTFVHGNHTRMKPISSMIWAIKAQTGRYGLRSAHLRRWASANGVVARHLLTFYAIGRSSRPSAKVRGGDGSLLTERAKSITIRAAQNNGGSMNRAETA